MTQHGHKRKRGGQPGNRNARTHGFYAARLTEREIGCIWDAVINDGLAPAAAVLRVKLDAALRADPANLRLRRDAARLLARLYGSGLDAAEGAVFTRLVEGLLQTAPPDETNRA